MTDSIEELVVEVEAFADHGSDLNTVEADRLLYELAHTLKAEHERAEKETQQRLDWASYGAQQWAENWERQIDEARDERDALAAVIEEAKRIAARDNSISVFAVLAKAPADTLRARDETKWDEGHRHCFHVEDPNNPIKGNPYRDTEGEPG